MNNQKKISLCLCILFSSLAFGQGSDALTALKGLDAYMEKALKEWNTPGAGIGIVVKNKLVFAKGYGYRNYGKKLPVTPNTLFQIASNTKLFTSIADGMLVEEGRLEWDKPVRNYVPAIRFYNNELNNTVTLRDMLSHRTGISRHDAIWYKSDFNRQELFDRLQYLEPSQPLRQGYLYNNIMYAAAGHIIELITHKTWESFVQERILNPLDMKNTLFSIADMKKQADHMIPYNERRDTTTLYESQLYEETGGLGPAGGIVSSINDLSHWLIALMNNGGYNGKQVLPPAVINATLEPAITDENPSFVKGYKELLNPTYGMGRSSVSYRGHLLVNHGGSLNGVYSQVGYMPQDSIGVIVFVIGGQSRPLRDIISYNVFERLLGLDQAPWSERELKDAVAGKKAEREARAKANFGRVAGTKPSHPLEDYTGQFEHPAYGIIAITKKDSSLQFALHKIAMPLSHFHYDRFDTPNDEEDGLFSVNFNTNPQGDIDRFAISLDQAEAIFIRKPDTTLSNPVVLASYAGKYDYAGMIVDVALKDDSQLFLTIPGQPANQLVAYKKHVFRVKEFSDVSVEFVTINGKVTEVRYRTPAGEYVAKRK